MIMKPKDNWLNKKGNLFTAISVSMNTKKALIKSFIWSIVCHGLQ